MQDSAKQTGREVGFAQRMHRPGTRLAEWIGLGLVAALLVAFRLHAFDLPLETDECNYAYIGARLLDGDRLYVDVWDHQPFGVFALAAGVIALFGDVPEVFRWLATVFSLGSLVLIYLIARRAGGAAVALSAAVTFAFASSDPGTAGEGCNREIYMNTFVLAAWYWAVRGTGIVPVETGAGSPCHRATPRTALAAGLMLGLGSTIKTVLAVHWVALAAWLALEQARSVRAGERLAAVLKTVGSLAAGPAVIWAGAFAYFGSTGRLNAFVDAVFRFNVGYSQGTDAFFMRFVRVFSPPRHPGTFDSAAPLWLGAMLALVWLVARSLQAGRVHRADQPGREHGPHGGSYGAAATSYTALVALGVGAFAAVCLPGRFWPHYYYLLVPPAALLAAVGAGDIAAWIRERLGSNTIDVVPASATGGRRYLAAAANVAMLSVIPAATFATQYVHYLRQAPFGITVNRYNSRDFWGRAQGQNVARVTDSGDSVFVFGNEAEIYYYSRRRCASRYTMITGLQEGQAGAEARREILLAELEQRRPRVIIVLFDERPFPAWREFLDRHYGQPVGVDRHDKTGAPIMFVFVRRDQPIEQINWDWDRSEVGGWFPRR